MPTGEILLLGGSSAPHGNGGSSILPAPVYQPELYYPGEEPDDADATSVAMNASDPVDIGGGTLVSTPRLYHSVAVLLLDGRVLLMGGQNAEPEANYPLSKFTGEIFSPPYLFKFPSGARPVINDATSPVEQSTSGETVTFEVSVTMAGEHGIDRVVLLRPAAVTHHFDMDQRYIELEFNAVYDQTEPYMDVSLIVEAPRENLGPPGYYILFVIENDGEGDRVPSIGQFIKFTEPS